MFDDFDFSLLDDPDFKEDSVREELIVPLLKKLGYTASGFHKIVRGKALTHPYIYIGSKKYKVNIFPDYLLVVDDENKWILDAKAPNENIHSGKNPEQAFSYAIHPEVRAKRYSLCNGRQIVIFDVSKKDPIISIEMSELSNEFREIERLLSPIAFQKPYIFDFKQDFGITWLKLGYEPNFIIYFIPMGIPTIAKVEEGLYTAFVNIGFGEDDLATSFDFDETRYRQLLLSIPEKQADLIKASLERQPFQIIFDEDDIPELCIEAKLGEEIISNENEEYCPLIVNKFYSL